ncbi:MAG: hypothetical protein ACFFDI_24380 [Promethearchaeota archaeon]
MTLQSDKILKTELRNKLTRLQRYFTDKIVIVAYSDGVDSTVLAEVGHRFAKG